MKCQNLFPGKNKKKIMSAENFPDIVLGIKFLNVFRKFSFVITISHRLTKPIMTCAPSEDSDQPRYSISLGSLYESVATY